MDYEKINTSELLKKFGMLYHLTHYDITLLTREACQNYDRVLGELERRLSNSAGEQKAVTDVSGEAERLEDAKMLLVGVSAIILDDEHPSREIIIKHLYEDITTFLEREASLKLK